MMPVDTLYSEGSPQPQPQPQPVDVIPVVTRLNVAFKVLEWARSLEGGLTSIVNQEVSELIPGRKLNTHETGLYNTAISSVQEFLSPISDAN